MLLESRNFAGGIIPLKRFVSILPGRALLVACAIVVRQYGEPWIKLSWKPGFDLLHLNAMLLSFLLGMTLGNLLPRPAWAAEGVAGSAMVLKACVVIMGSLYSFVEIGKIGQTSLLMIFFLCLRHVWFCDLAGKAVADATRFDGRAGLWLRDLRRFSGDHDCSAYGSHGRRACLLHRRHAGLWASGSAHLTRHWTVLGLSSS